MNKSRILALALVLLISVSTLAGSTIAWFTDEVTSAGNIITSGTLDVGMDWAKGTLNPADSGVSWEDASTGAIFNHDLWEPGYADARHLRIRNVGSLALAYQLKIVPVGAAGKLADVIDVYYLDPAQQLSRDALASAQPVGTLTQLISGNASFKTGMLEAGQAGKVSIALKMQESAGNEYMNQSIGSSFAVQLVATQAVSESDAFGNDYDSAALSQLDGVFSVSVSLEGKLDGNKVSEELAIGSSGGISAVIPKGVKVEDGATELVLNVENISRSEEIPMSDGEVSMSFEVHIDGIASDNRIPMQISLGKALPDGLKNTSVKLYHVEDGRTNQMTMVDSVDKFVEHNQFVYDSASGEAIVNIASFSEITAVVALSDPWDGTEDTGWYDAAVTTYEISTAEQLAGLGALVAAGNDFAGKTIKLTSDLDLAGQGGKVFYPIGYRYNSNDSNDTLYPFKGIFDGQNHRIAHLSQNTWNIKGHYDNGYYKKSLGLFALIEGATVKNITLEQFILEGEFAPTGCVAGRAKGGTFENITLRRCAPATYNTGVGGIVGLDAGSGAEYTFNNITVGSSNTIIALWGSWDVGCGGIMGMLDDTSKVTMNNCTVAAKLDVYNDVCANYQYYQYRYSGMLIGTIGSDGDPRPEANDNLKCTDCKVYIGKWADYYYCEFEKNSGASYTEDFQFSRVNEKDIVFDLNGNVVSCTHQHTENEDKLACYLPFSQLYTGYSWGATAVYEHPGVEVIHYAYDIIYMDGIYVIDVEYVSKDASKEAYKPKKDAGDGYNWIDATGTEVTTIPANHDRSVVLYLNNLSKYYARFVDKDGIEIYSEEFAQGATKLNSEPAVPAVAGYYGMWEAYVDRLKTAKADIIIRPIYTMDENQVQMTSSNINELAELLAQGKTAVMGTSLSGSFTGGNQSLYAEVTRDTSERVDKVSDLVLNSYQLSYDQDSSANKNWTIFQINGDSQLNVSCGLSGYGSLVFNFNKMNSNAEPCFFNVKYGGKLVLERGVTIEINIDNSTYADKLTLFRGTDQPDAVDETGARKYPGLNIVKSNNGATISIVVTGTTTLIGNVPDNT